MSPSQQETVHSYDSTQRGVGAQYDYIFPERTTLAGFSKLRIFVSCLDHDDMDIYVMIRKLSSTGELMEQSNVPLHELPPDVKTVKDVKNVSPCKYLGPTGMLRASHREFDPEKSTEYWPFHTHRQADFVKPGDVVELNIGIWPMGVVFEKGEGLRVVVSGRDMRLAEWDNPHVAYMEPVFNKGSHRIHLGGKYAETYVLLPKV
jgi:predicted acyl esterase